MSHPHTDVHEMNLKREVVVSLLTRPLSNYTESQAKAASTCDAQIY